MFWRYSWSTQKNPPCSSTYATDQMFFSNCFTQQLMYPLMMDPYKPTGWTCRSLMFYKQYCKLNDSCVHLLVKIVETEL